MRLALIADSNQLGKSGVGDYALRLSEALEEFKVTVQVFPVGKADNQEKASLRRAVAHFQPDWVSFQFVPYAFGRRGLVHSRTLPWQQLRGRIGTHFMFHEIWIGAHDGATIRQRCIGYLQKAGIHSMMRAIRPQVTHCSNRVYSEMLSRAGIKNNILPLFGNIPISAGRVDPYRQLLTNMDQGSDRSDWVVAAFFGTLYSSRNLTPVIHRLQSQCQTHNRRLLIVSLGHCPDADSVFSQLASTFIDAAKPEFLIKGAMEASELSAWIGNADVGLATTPYNIIEKSGSALAFVEHGIPVIVMDTGSAVRAVNLPWADLRPHFWLADHPTFTEMTALPSRLPPCSRLEGVAHQFLADLERAKPAVN